VCSLLLWLGLGCHSKQAGDEGDLPAGVCFAHPSDLSLAHHVQDFVSLQCSLCRLEGKETHPWLDQPLDEAMVLFDDVVEILDADVSSTLSGKIPLALRSAIALG
jgi:hypothetical protein